MKKENNLKGYKFLRGILAFIFKLYYNPQIVNKEAIPKDGPIIICGNHKHLFDQNMAIISTKRMLHYLAKIEYFQDKKVAWFFKMAGCISVDRNAHDGKALNEAISLLKKGYAIGIFPEGTRNRTQEDLLPFKKGAVKMASETNATIVPFAIRGEYKFRSKVTIEFGKPFKVNNMSLEEANDKLFNEVKNLKKVIE